MRELRPGLTFTPMLELVRPIGQGGMGRVWVAKHKGLETQVVIKLLADDKELSDPEDAAARFAREAAAAAAVKSPHVVQILDHGVTDDGERYIVMELLEGRDLATHLETVGKMAPRDVAAMIGQVAKALTKAHQVGIVHRDIKPENIFLCDGEHGEMFVKVLDFGVAKWHQQLTSKTTTGQVVGTPYYMSPEQILGEQPVDGRSDIWSLGVVAFQALTGKRPFDGSTIGAITLAIHHKKPRPRQIDPELPPAVDDWFAMCCMHNAEGRYATAREAAQALMAAVGDQSTPLLVRPPEPSMIGDQSDPAIPIGGLQPKAERAVTSLSATFPAGVARKPLPPAVLYGGALLALLLVIGVLVAAFRGPSTPATQAGGGVPGTTSMGTTVSSSSPSAAAPTSTSTTTSTSTAAPPVDSAVESDPTSSSPAPSPKPVKPVLTAPPNATTAAKKPPRKPNDDDIK